MNSNLQEDDVQKILQRAAELQAFRSKAELEAPGEKNSPSDSQNGEERLLFIAQAAEELGIAREVFELAKAELLGSPTFKPVLPEQATKARKWLNNQERFFTLDVRVEQNQDAVLDALRDTLQGPDYLTEITNMVGEDPFTDGILIIEPGSMSEQFKPNFTRFKYDMVTADFRQVLITLRSDANKPESTMLSFYTNLDHSAKMSHVAGKITACILAPLAAAALYFPALSFGANALLAEGLGLFGASLGIMINHAGWQAMYKWGLGRGKKALQELANKITSSFKLKKITNK